MKAEPEVNFIFIQVAGELYAGQCQRCRMPLNEGERVGMVVHSREVTLTDPILVSLGPLRMGLVLVHDTCPELDVTPA